MTDPSSYVRERHNDGKRDVRWPAAPEPLTVPVYDNHTHLEIADGDEPLDPRRAARARGGRRRDRRRAGRWRHRVEPVVGGCRGIPPPRARGRRDPPERGARVRRGRPARRGDRRDRRARRAAARAGDRRDRPGLLPHRGGRPPAQFERFEAHIALAKKHGLAMQIHDRDAHDAVLETLAARRRAGAHGVPLLLRRRGDGADRAPTAATTCRSPATSRSRTPQNLRDALAVTPRERILVETDAPFLTPTPHRGRPNAPYLIPVTVRFIAAELGVDLDEFCAQLAANTVRGLRRRGMT